MGVNGIKSQLKTIKMMFVKIIKKPFIYTNEV